LHCVDYDKGASLLAGQIRNSNCNAFPRGVPNTATFGEDRGYNYQPISNNACRSGFANIVRYQRGRSYRLLWPAKNHVAAPCTNPNINDQSLKLYLYPVSHFQSSDPSFTTWTSSRYLFFDFKKDGDGFQNCPDACPVVDRLPCYGDLFIPNSLPTGNYKALWVWIFNPNERFTHCFDIEVYENPTKSPTTKSPTTKSPTTKSPTAKSPTTKSPTAKSPTTKSPTAKSPTAKSPTAKSPTAKSPTAKSPTAKSPTAKSPTVRCANLYQQCGGQGWTGTTCCNTGSCQVFNPNYSQCRP
jgi:hypothetical protein